jgi:large subunit ribosomal protein L22
MEVTAKAKFIRIAPRKVRLVTNLIKGMNVVAAVDQLNFLSKKSAHPVLKLLNSAIANAENNFELQKNNLFIKSLTASEGPTIHRWMPKAHGSATPIRKRTTHINIVLAEAVPSDMKTKSNVKKSKIEMASSKPKDIASSEKGESVVNVDNENISTEVGASKDPEIFDVRMKGKHRHKQNLDKKSKKDKNFLKKIFNRKSG